MFQVYRPAESFRRLSIWIEIGPLLFCGTNATFRFEPEIMASSQARLIPVMTRLGTGRCFWIARVDPTGTATNASVTEAGWHSQFGARLRGNQYQEQLRYLKIATEISGRPMLGSLPMRNSRNQQKPAHSQSQELDRASRPYGRVLAETRRPYLGW
jgi:hypothetical protein